MSSEIVPKNRRVLVVDDTPAIHVDFRKILGVRGAKKDSLDSAAAELFGTGPTTTAADLEFEVDSAYLGEEGLRRVVEACETGRPYAVAFVDMRMPPGWDGLETVTRMWQVQPDLQVVICTAYSDHSWDELFRRLGRSDRLLVLKKPFDNIEVQQLAAALSDKWRVTQEAKLKIEDLERRVLQRTAELHGAMDHLAQSRKMEAIGQLAGGVAHDYNNILTATIIQLDLLSSDPGVTPSIRSSVRELEKMAHRAVVITRQLLTFSRQQAIDIKVIDLNVIVQNLLEMLGNLLGENVRIEFQRGPEPMCIEGDVGMIEQVVTNLCVNARDAMAPRGGQLAVALRHVTVDANTVNKTIEARPGRFVCVTVRDTGCGMDERTIARIFEPFFTTKPVGQGTGLGLSTVFGIAKQHRGWINVHSEVRAGSTFSLFLPAAQAVAAVRAPNDSVRSSQCSACILLVEDDRMIREVVTLTLKKAGHRVLAAVDGIHALRLWSDHSFEIELLFSDMVMPNGLTGLDLFRRFSVERPGLRAIITSGYSIALEQARHSTDQNVSYLAKPYEMGTLTSLIHEVLAASR